MSGTHCHLYLWGFRRRTTRQLLRRGDARRLWNGLLLGNPSSRRDDAAALRPVSRSWRSLRMAADGTDMVRMVIDGQGILALGQNEDRSEIEASG